MALSGRFDCRRERRKTDLDQRVTDTVSIF